MNTQGLLPEGAVLLKEFALPLEALLQEALAEVMVKAPLRHMFTPNGYKMSVAMTSCGPYGWVTDRRGYRYQATDPLTGQAWPVFPPVFLQLATEAAQAAGFGEFQPDSCLINQYEPGAKLSLHQDKDEQDFSAPIVSVSLGVPATFLLGGLQRSDRQIRIPLVHGDVLVLGGKARLLYHGVLPLKANTHSFFGQRRINLTFRKAN
jgi:alkylated DNA repair protein (DNA oxidative demethylase)